MYIQVSEKVVYGLSYVALYTTCGLNSKLNTIFILSIYFANYSY